MDYTLPGFRFYPTEEELVSFYLQNKLNGTRTDLHTVIPVIDIYDYNPWDLPQFGGEICPAAGEQWFFFSPRQEREGRGGRPNRLTREGYWKATGSPADVYSSQNNCVIGRKRSMVFYFGRAPNGTKTTWKMNEYKLIDSDEASSSSAPQLREELSLCRIYKRSRSIRAFDRRPSSEAMTHLHHHENDSSGHATNASQYSLENDDNPSGVSTTGEPCWDSDQFNWLDIPEVMQEQPNMVIYDDN